MSKNKWGGKRLGVGREAKLNKAAVLKHISQSLVLVCDSAIGNIKNQLAVLGQARTPFVVLLPANDAPSVRIPFLLDKIPAGFPSPAEGYIENQLDLNEYLIHNKPATFIVRAGGDSMCDVGIDKDDMLIIDRSLTAVHLDIVMADLGSEFTIKRLHIKGQKMALHSENKQANYPILTPHDNEIWTIVGVVTAVIKVFKK